MRLERVIQVRKLMFIRTIIVMGDDELLKKIVCERANMYFSNLQTGEENVLQSATFGLLNTCTIFGLLGHVKNIVEKHHFYPKLVWKNIILEKGWQLENLHYRIEKQLHKSLDILCGVSPVNRYL